MKQTCNRCVMDSDVPDIIFNEEGNCNYCEEFIAMMTRNVQPDPIKRQAELDLFVDQVKRDGKGKEYDCIIGLSGGVDSAWVLYQAKKVGLRPLAVHMDNGWNSELAQNNIENIVKKLEIPLYTHVINWEEYKGLMQTFFDADVVDVELLYDNAMLAVNYKLASKYNLKWILAGTNNSTEGIKIPSGWNWYKFDAINIKNIAKRRNIKIKTFPIIGGINKIYYEKIRGIRWVSFLDMMNYEKNTAIDELKRVCGYRPYPYKHYESIFTRFYQGYILPRKFGIDKRKVHFSSLIVTGQMSRIDALRDLDRIPYPSNSELNSDLEYFLKKMNWSDQALQDYIGRERVSHDKYLSEKYIKEKFNKFLGLGKYLLNIKY